MHSALSLSDRAHRFLRWIALLMYSIYLLGIFRIESQICRYCILRLFFRQVLSHFHSAPRFFKRIKHVLNSGRLLVWLGWIYISIGSLQTILTMVSNSLHNTKEMGLAGSNILASIIFVYSQSYRFFDWGSHNNYLNLIRNKKFPCLICRKLFSRFDRRGWVAMKKNGKHCLPNLRKIHPSCSHGHIIFNWFVVRLMKSDHFMR